MNTSSTASRGQGVQPDGPADEAVLGIERGERGHGAKIGNDLAGAEVAQLVEQAERVGAVAQDVGVEGDPDRPAGLPGGGLGRGSGASGSGASAPAPPEPSPETSRCSSATMASPMIASVESGSSIRVRI